MQNNRPNQTTIRCSNCGQPYQTVVRTSIDVSQDAQGKALLLAGQLNSSQCPHCGAVNSMAVPLLYHDADKELLIALVPMELNMNKDQQERVVGDLMKTLPKENFKGYMFNPKRALTMQGLLDMVLQADGITPEMMEEQRQRVQLIQQMTEADDPTLQQLIADNDAQIDVQFLQTMSVMAQRFAQSGRPDIAEQVAQTQQVVLQFSTLGQQLAQQQADQEAVIQQVADEIEALGEEAQLEDFRDLAVRYADDDARIQALVGLIRPLFDNQFFQDFSVFIGQQPADQREKLEALRDKMLLFAQMVDQQQQSQMQQAAALLQGLINVPPEQLDQAIVESLPLIDDTFMAILSANVQEAQKRQDLNMSAKLREVYDRIVSILQRNMQPELVFLNQLLAAPTTDEAKAMLAQQGKDYGPALVEAIDAVSTMLRNQNGGQGDPRIFERLDALRQEAVTLVP
jgi:hypothetical protein